MQASVHLLFTRQHSFGIIVQRFWATGFAVTGCSNIHFLCQKLLPIVGAPRAGNFTHNDTIPQDSWGDMYTVLPAELDYVDDFNPDNRGRM